MTVGSALWFGAANVQRDRQFDRIITVGEHTRMAGGGSTDRTGIAIRGRSRIVASAVVLLATLVAVLPTTSERATGAVLPPTGFSDVNYVGNLTAPTHMAWAPDGRLSVAGQHGAIRVVSASGTLRSTPFVSLTVDHTGDRGINGIAFDPQFSLNGYVYVYYTAPTPVPHNRVSRFTASGDVAVSGSEVVILELPNLGDAKLHNGGALVFLSDGTLLISVGDNVQGWPARRLDSLLGKILRINRNGTAPADNPYASLAYPYSTIWASGLRNPYTMGLRESDDTVLINDVGESTWEEVNLGRPGANYGWPDAQGVANDPRWVDPAHAYHHGSGPSEGCSVIGGDFAHEGSTAFPASYTDRYFFADYCNGWIKVLDPATGYAVSSFATGLSNPVFLNFGPDRALYYVSRQVGTGASSVRRIAYTGTAPTITAEPGDVTAVVGADATFSVVASGAGPLTYQWHRNGVVIDGATASTYTGPSVTVADDGTRFRVVVSNATGQATSREALLTVVEGSAPVVTLVSPEEGRTFKAGTVVGYSATAIDSEDGSLPASAFDWRVDFHHDTHVHGFFDPDPGQKSGSFTVPDRQFETDPDIWFRIYLTVTDSSGLTTTVTREVLPLLGTLSIATSPSGSPVAVDDQPVTTPASLSGLRFLWRSVDVPNPASGWAFDAWSDGGTQRHGVSVPATLSLTAVLHRTTGALGDGTGLTGTYFDDVGLTQPVTSRVDRIVFFRWKPGSSPAPGVSGSTYSTRWTGKLQAQFSGQHTFSVRADDGMRLWVNNQLLIDEWGTLTGSTERTSAPISLTAGQRYDIKLETRQGYSRAGQARLLWKAPTLPKSVVPGSQLFPL